MLFHPFSEILSTRRYVSDSGDNYLDMKIGDLMVQKILRIETDQVRALVPMVMVIFITTDIVLNHLIFCHCLTVIHYHSDDYVQISNLVCSHCAITCAKIASDCNCDVCLVCLLLLIL